jgi:lycopene cyclase domain-containing protein
VGIPLLLSFDKRLQFYKKWKYVLPSITFIAIIYIAFDVAFTHNRIWGFNPSYLSGLSLFNLPLEEILFFFAIPYASLFLHYSFVEYFPQIKLNETWNKAITFSLIFISLFLIFSNHNKQYTLYIFSKVFLVLFLSLFDKSRVTQHFYITFLIILIPFILVNGILTGTGISEEVVWYNNAENLGIRIFTIPVEDFGYAFSMILFNLLLIKKFEKIFQPVK